MPRNGNGIYSLPAGNPVVTGSTISSSVQNTTMTDVQNALTTSIASDGQTVPTANLPMGGFKLTGLATSSAPGDSVRYEDLAASGYAQTFTFYTTAGTAPAYTITPAPALIAYAAGQRFNVSFNAAGTIGSNTINVSALGAKNLKQYGTNGIKQAAFITANLISDIEYDGTDFIVLDPLITSSGFKNRLINGSFIIDQVNAGGVQTVVPGAATYFADGWYLSCTGGNISLQQSGSTGNYGIGGNAGNTGAIFGQRIESYNTADLVNSNVTGQLKFSSNTITSVTWNAYYANSQDNYTGKTLIATGSFAVNSTPNVYSFVFNAGANAANGIAIEYVIGALTSGAQFSVIGGGQLELGSIPTSLEVRPYGLELALCQRYFEKSYNQGIAVGASGQTSAGDAQQIAIDVTNFYSYRTSVAFKVTKRATPTIVTYNPSTGVVGTFWDYNTGATLGSSTAVASQNGCGFYAGSNNLTASHTFGTHWTANARL